MGDVATGVAHDTTWPFVVAAEELRAENERLRSVVAAVEAVVDELGEEVLRARVAYDDTKRRHFTSGIRLALQTEAYVTENAALRLRSVLSDTRQEEAR